MGSTDNSVKIHEHCLVAPSSATATTLSLPLTFFDLTWLKFHPVERIFFYSLPLPLSNPSLFFHKLLPNLKTSLSHTLHHFTPLAGNIVWPSHSAKPFIQFNPGDGVSLVLAQYNNDAKFNHFLDNSPRDASEARTLVPHLESSDSLASVISLQITLFPNKGFSIGISSHHAVLDGKSSTMFIKAWAYACKSLEQESPISLMPELEPLFDRDLIKDPTGLETMFINTWKQISYHMDPSDTTNGRSLKIMSLPTMENLVRATFDLTRGDLEKIKKRVLSKWELVEEEAEPISASSKPNTLSTFVTCCAYVSVCIAKATHEAQNAHKFSLAFTVNCRARLEPPISENYFGNCVASHIVDTQPEDFIKEDGVVIVAKRIWSKTKILDKGAIEGIDTVIPRFIAMLTEGVKGMSVAGSNRFGVYETDFGWGRPAKVEITSVDRGLNIGLAESKNERGGVEVGLALNKHVMDLFHAIFYEGLRID